jgi:hypothetical protein
MIGGIALKNTPQRNMEALTPKSLWGLLGVSKGKLPGQFLWHRHVSQLHIVR